MGGTTPDLLPVNQTPHLSPLHQSRLVGHRVFFRSIKVSAELGKFKLFSSVMADDLLYHFSDEDDDEDALLDRAYDRWEQLGSTAARGPLFQFTMQPIGRQCRWCEVMEWAQFNAQLQQLRDPVAGDNIGMALTEALHQAIEGEVDQEQ